MVKKAEVPAPETRTLIVNSKGGEVRRIVIPKDWTLTYGPVVVGASRQDHGGQSPNVLRIYSDAGKKNLMAVFRNVEDLMDEAVELRVKVTKAKTKSFVREEANGQQVYNAVIKKTTWRDPNADVEEDDGGDDLPETILSLPTAAEGEEGPF